MCLAGAGLAAVVRYVKADNTLNLHAQRPVVAAGRRVVFSSCACEHQATGRLGKAWQDVKLHCTSQH